MGWCEAQLYWLGIATNPAAGEILMMLIHLQLQQQVSLGEALIHHSRGMHRVSVKLGRGPA